MSVDSISGRKVSKRRQSPGVFLKYLVTERGLVVSFSALQDGPQLATLEEESTKLLPMYGTQGTYSVCSLLWLSPNCPFFTLPFPLPLLPSPAARADKSQQNKTNRRTTGSHRAVIVQGSVASHLKRAPEFFQKGENLELSHLIYAPTVASASVPVPVSAASAH